MTHRILAIAAELAGTTPDRAFGRFCGELRRTGPELTARQIAASALRGLGYSSPVVAGMIGEGSHTSVLALSKRADPGLVRRARAAFRERATRG